MLLFDHNIPPFLHSSPYLQALLNEGQIPESGIEIPDGCLQANLTVTTQNDLRELLQTFRFWLLPELAENCMELLWYALKPANKSAFLLCAAEFKDEIPFLKEIMLILESKRNQKVATAAEFARGHVVKHLVEELHCPINIQAGVVAAREGKSECLEYLHSHGLELNRKVCRAACSGGHIECVKFMIDNKAKLYRECAQHCASQGHFACVKYAVENTNFTLDQRNSAIVEAFRLAAMDGHLDCLLAMMKEWGDAQNTSSMTLEAARYGHLAVLKLAQQRGATLNDFSGAMDAAADNGHFRCVQYLCEIGCMPTIASLEFAAENRDWNIFLFLVEHNCPMNGDICATLASNGDLDMLKYARQHGCPWDERTCEAAAHGGHLGCLKYAHEGGCPWVVEDATQLGSASGGASDDESDDDEESGEEDEEYFDTDIWEEEENASAGEGEGDSDSSSSWEPGNDSVNNEEPEHVQDITLSASFAPTIDCLLYVVSQGVPVHPHCGKEAAKGGCAEILLFLYTLGFTYSAGDCAAAAGARAGSLESLRFLHEIGTPWDARTCSSAASYGHLECLKYAHENGCPWDENTIRISRFSKPCYEYAVANGCPGAELYNF